METLLSGSHRFGENVTNIHNLIKAVMAPWQWQTFTGKEGENNKNQGFFVMEGQDVSLGQEAD